MSEWAVAVYLSRRSHLKTLSPVIDAALRRYHDEDMVIVCDPQAAKKGDKLDRGDVERLWPQAVVLGAVPQNTRAVVGLQGALPYLVTPLQVGVDPFFDTWLSPPTGLDRRHTCYHSDFHRDMHHAEWGGALMKRTHVVGWLPSDQALECPIPAARNTAVFFTLKLDVPEPWRKSRQGLEFYRSVYDKAKQRAKDEGLFFIVKSRAKNKDPRWVWKGADAYVLDEEMVPYTSLTLLARATWAVHFESGAALECALMGAYGYVIRVPQAHVERLPGGEHIYWRDIRRPAPRLQEWEGVTHYDLGWAGRPYTIDPKAREEYLDHFIGPHDGRVADRVLDVCEGK
jgi:hypothetical protein